MTDILQPPSYYYLDPDRRPPCVSPASVAALVKQGCEPAPARFAAEVMHLGGVFLPEHVDIRLSQVEPEGSSAESVGRIEVLLKEVWVGWGRSAGRRDKALAALGARLPRTVGPGRQPAARVLRCAAVLRMTAATDRAGGPCGPAGRLALDRLAASATAERRSVVAEDRRKRPRTLDAGSAHARPGSCLTMTSSRRPHRRGDDPVPNDRTRPSQQNASRSGNPRQFGVGTPKRRGRRTGCNSRVS